MSADNQLPDLDPLLDLDADAPSEFKCPITMSIMKNPVIMPDGQTYEREAIENALKVNPISPLTRQPMDMSQAKTNYALKSLIDKYIQDHRHEIDADPEVIDPTKMEQVIRPEDQIPVANINQIELESFTAEYKDDSMLVSIKPKDIEGRLPVSIIAIIDISGSMEDDAALPVPGTENASFSRIQLVQYSLKTIISILGDADCITLITFSDKAKVELENVHLSLRGKQIAGQIIDSLRPRGCTNIWDALDKGIDQALKEKSDKEQKDVNQRNTSLLLFTDGEPNINPPIGIIPTLTDKLSEFESHFTISTFGFGYEIDSDLMVEIAKIGNGIYGYCPDVTMVGTVFINYLSNLISTISPLAVLTVQNKEYPTLLYNGASANIMVPLSKEQQEKGAENIQINLKLPLTNQTFLVDQIKKLDDDENSLNFFRDQKYRKSLIDLILASKNNLIENDQSRKNVIDLFSKMKSENNRSQFMNNLMIDLFNDDEKHGQIERAYRKEYFQKWGKNYIYSLLRYHTLEQCGNYKDLSLQLYGNEIFRKIRKIGNKVFMNLPIPQGQNHARSRSPSSSKLLRKSSSRLSSNSNLSSKDQISHHMSSQPNQQKKQSSNFRRMTMRSFTCSTTVCFNGDALIDLWNGQKKKVANVKKGDKLSNGAKVICLVKTPTENGVSHAVKVGDALFTPYHPVFVHIEGEVGKSWNFPIDIGEPQKVEIDFWYNMVIDRENSPVVIGGVETLTLGHNMKRGICFHPYYGTQKVVDALKKYEQFEKGIIEFKDPPVVKRDPATNMVIECF